MEFRQLRYFVEVAEQKHYGKAAEKISISQPALSQQIKLLEQNLGFDLFDKTDRKNYRKVTLTEAGDFFLKEAKRILSEIQKFENELKGFAKKKKVIRLGVYKALLKERIVEFMEDFSSKNPDSELQIHEYDDFVAVQKALLNKEIERGLTLLPLINDTIKFDVLKSGGLSLILSKNHKSANQEISIETLLKNEKWIELSPKFHPFYSEIEKCCLSLGIRREISQEVSSLSLLISLVALNKGVAFAPSLFDFSQEPQILQVPVSGSIFESIEIKHIVATH